MPQLSPAFRRLQELRARHARMQATPTPEHARVCEACRLDWARPTHVTRDGTRWAIALCEGCEADVRAGDPAARADVERVLRARRAA